MQLVEQFISFLKNQKNQPSKATVKNYKADVSQFIRWFEERFKNLFDPNKATFQVVGLYKESQSFSASSIERHLSSLRKFFNFLKLEGIISQSPLELNAKRYTLNADQYRIKDFKDFLYVYNASHLTIKNYIIDVKQFFKWAEEVTDSKNEWDLRKKNVLTKIDSSFIEEYKNRLLEQEFLPSTVNRKLSSLRKYFAWAQAENLLRNGIIEVRSETSLTTEKGSLDNLISDNQNVKDSKSRISNFPHQKFQSQYSPLPPIRLAQKVFNVFELVFDYLVIFPLAKLGETFDYVFWQIQGKPVFKATRSHLVGSSTFDPLSSIIRRVSNISKEMYAPLSISTKSFPWHRKAWHHLRHTRPNWYRTYHSYPITHYFHLAILIIFMTAVGFAMYNAFAKGPQQSPTFAAAPVA
ncbi:MAG: site-specific integrase, partial [Candidatus Levybacteria bacterium]|nr:site-specific integrase [Candidatus Levybacteria bacterium]